MKKTLNFSRYAKNYDNRKDFDRILLDFKCRTLFVFRPKLGVTLELGCAMGLMSQALAERATRLDIIDGSAEYIKITRQLLEKKFPSQKKDIRYFTQRFETFVPTQQYDSIILAGVLPALSSPVTFLRLIRPWLKKNGSLYITSHNAYSLHRRLGKAMGLVKDVHTLSPRDSKLFGHKKVYDFDSICADVTKASFRIQKAGGVFLKPFPNVEMEKMKPKIIEALYLVSMELDPRLCAELFVFARKS